MSIARLARSSTLGSSSSGSSKLSQPLRPLVRAVVVLKENSVMPNLFFYIRLVYNFSPPVSSSDRSLASRRQNLLSATEDSRHGSFVPALMRGAVPGEKKDGGGKIIHKAY